MIHFLLVAVITTAIFSCCFSFGWVSICSFFYIQSLWRKLI